MSVPMHPTLEKIHQELVYLHSQEDTLTSLSSTRCLKFKIRPLESPLSSSSAQSHRRLPLKPWFFLPSKPDKKSKTKTKSKKRSRFRKRSRSCARAASCAAISSSSSSPSPSSAPEASPARLADSDTASLSLSLRPPSLLSSFSLSACGSASESRVGDFERGRRHGHGRDHDHESTVTYAPILQSLAESQGLELPKLPKDTRRAILKSNGPVTKGKARQNPAIELHEDGKWRITQVLEDTTYTHPHAIVEIVVSAQGPTDGLSLTISEIKAIVRVMRLRMEIKQYRHFPRHPLLAISYIEDMVQTDGGEEKTEYRSARILQAHHDGKTLVIQYSQRLLFTSEMASSSLDKLLQYYLSEPMMAGDLAEKKETDPPHLLQSWNAIKRRRRSVQSDAGEPNDEKESQSLRQWFSKKLSFGN